MMCKASSKLATGPTIAHPASPTIISISAEIIASSSTIRICRPASPMPGLVLLPAAGEASGFCRPGGLMKGGAIGMRSPDLPAPSFRIERDPQIDPQPVLLEFDPRLSSEPMADFAFDQVQSEAGPWRLAHRRSAALDPVQHQAALT